MLTDLPSVESFLAVRTLPAKTSLSDAWGRAKLDANWVEPPPPFLVFTIDPYKNLVSDLGFGIPCRRFPMGIDQHSHVLAGLQF
jgi:hypothetical protein